MNEEQTRLDPALYVVATPLGNLGDITLRALEVLRSAAVVAAEDTRHTRRLLSHYQIRTDMIAVHEHNESSGALSVAERLERGQAVAYVTDAGTPGISDPGVVLVRRIREAGWPVVPVPGASALTAALSAAGVEAAQFMFHGFLPPKTSARRKALAAVAQLPYTAVFYEAPHRLQETLVDMAAAFGAQREIVIARELTKMFESWHRCSLANAAAWIAEDPLRSKGEFVLIVPGAPERVGPDPAAEVKRTLALLLAELPLSRAVALAAQITGVRKNILYEAALELKPSELP
jgi:16S rRNA (cytidine1402-2'-O)-methyltransferase